MRASEGSCPFCGASRGEATIVPSAAGRLARGALFVFASVGVAAGVGAGVVACGGSTETDTGGVAPPYGVPADTGTMDTGRVDSGGDAGGSDGTVDDTGGPMPKYGAPPPPDASGG